MDVYLAAVERPGDNGPRSLAIAIGIALATYALSCAVWPWKKCRGERWKLRSCDGGRVYHPWRRRHDSFRHCRRCRGTAKQRRLGTWLWAVGVRLWRRARVHR